MPQVHWEQHQPLKIVALDPDQVFIHTSAFTRGIAEPGLERPRRKMSDPETDAPALRCLRGL